MNTTTQITYDNDHKYEYKSQYYGGNGTKYLNQLLDQGWIVHTITTIYNNEYLVIFKRQKS